MSNWRFGIVVVVLIGKPPLMGEVLCNKLRDIELAKFTLQEMCCGFLLSREMWYRKSVLPGTGAG